MGHVLRAWLLVIVLMGIFARLIRAWRRVSYLAVLFAPLHTLSGQVGRVLE